MGAKQLKKYTYHDFLNDIFDIDDNLKSIYPDEVQRYLKNNKEKIASTILKKYGLKEIQSSWNYEHEEHEKNENNSPFDILTHQESERDDAFSATEHTDDHYAQNLHNLIMLYIDGTNKKNYFFWNELVFEGDISGNLYDIDKKQKRPDSEYEYPILSYWARTAREGEVDYISISSLADFLAFNISSILMDVEDEIVKSSIDSLPNNGEKTQKGYFQLSIQKDAENANESLFLKYADFILYEMEVNIHNELSQKYKDLHDVWVIDEDKVSLFDNITHKEPLARKMHVIFSSVDELKKVDDKHFWDDVYKLNPSSIDKLQNIINEEVEHYTSVFKHKLESAREYFIQQNNLLIDNLKNIRSEDKIVGFDEKLEAVKDIIYKIMKGQFTLEELLSFMFSNFKNPYDEKDFEQIIKDYVNNVIPSTPQTSSNRDKNLSSISYKREMLSGIAYLNLSVINLEYRYDNYIRLAFIALSQVLPSNSIDNNIVIKYNNHNLNKET